MTPTPEQITAWARELADQAADDRGRKTFEFDEHGLSRFAALAFAAGAAHAYEESTTAGFQLVPTKPTPAMLDVAVSHALMVGISSDYNWSAYMTDVWSRMVNAAPDAIRARTEQTKGERG